MVDDPYDSNNDFENSDFDTYKSSSVVNSGKEDWNGTRANRRSIVDDMGRPHGNDDYRNDNKADDEIRRQGRQGRSLGRMRQGNDNCVVTLTQTHSRAHAHAHSYLIIVQTRITILLFSTSPSPQYM